MHLKILTKVFFLKHEARQMKRNYKIDIIVIDYISLITTLQNNIPRYEQIAFLSRNIRSLAFELEISTIVLSQVARSAEGRDSGLSTLEESSVLEQNADIVIFYIKKMGDIKGEI